MLGAMIVPTGIGCSVGGDVGDSTVAARILATTVDHLIVHPNVVNACDINEMTPNMLYVDGSLLDEWLAGNCVLKQRLFNRVLVVTNSPVEPVTENTVRAARCLLGMDIDVLALREPFTMTASDPAEGSQMTGLVTGVEALAREVQARQHFSKFRAIALHTPITVPTDVARRYYEHGGLNPWGGVEAHASRLVSQALGHQYPVAHAPIENDHELMDNFNQVVREPVAAEMISRSYLFSVLKGLHRAPVPTIMRPGHRVMSWGVEDLDFMVSPWPCHGPAHRACNEAGVPIIYVHENTPAVQPAPGWDCHDRGHHVKNYVEAAGLVQAWKAGVHL